MFKQKLPLTLLIISITFFLIILFNSELTLEGRNRSYYLKYYILTIILIIFSIITFYINKKLKEYLNIVILSIFFSVYGFQTYLTLKYSGVTGQNYIEKKIKAAKKQGIEFDYRQKITVYKELKDTKYKNLKVTVSPRKQLDRKLDILPLSGVSNSVTLNCNENGYYSTFISDRYGFNNLDYEWDQKEIEYLLVGDSFVLGNCVNRPNDLTSILRKLSNKSVLNIGYSHNGPLLEYAGLREYYHPKMKNIIWVYYENDLDDFRAELNSNILKKYIRDMNFKQNLINKQNEIDSIINKVISEETNQNISLSNHFEDNLLFKIKKFIFLWNVREIVFHRRLFKLKNKEKFIPYDEFIEIIKLAKNFADVNNSNFYFVYLPGIDRYFSKVDDTEYRFIKNSLLNLEINFIDIHEEVFKKLDNPLKLFPFELPGHYTLEGYNKIGEAIFSNINSEKIN